VDTRGGKKRLTRLLCGTRGYKDEMMKLYLNLSELNGMNKITVFFCINLWSRYIFLYINIFLGKIMYINNFELPYVISWIFIVFVYKHPIPLCFITIYFVTFKKNVQPFSRNLCLEFDKFDFQKNSIFLYVFILYYYFINLKFYLSLLFYTKYF
jgi:hypothetical protein